MPDPTCSRTHADELHVAGVAAARIARAMRAIHIVCRLGIVALAVATILRVGPAASVTVAVLVLLAVAGVSARVYGCRAWSYSRTVIRASIRHLAYDREVSSDFFYRLVHDDAPALVRWQIGRTAAGTPETVTDYYAPVSSSGIRRLRELYAHSSFFSWKVAQAFVRATLVAGVVLVLLLVLGLGTVSSADWPVEARLPLVEVLAVVLLVEVILSLAEGLAEGHQAAGTYRRCFDCFRSESTSPEELEARVAEYENERTQAPIVSGVFYRILRTGLVDQWKSRSADLFAGKREQP